MPRRLPLTLALAVCGAVASADEPVLFLREEGASAEAPPGAVTPAAPTAPDDRSEALARDALREARARFLAFAFADAAEGLRLASVRAAPSLVRGRRELLVELDLWAGACALLAERRDDSRASFRHALLISPDAALPEGVFPPSVEGFFAETRRAVMLETPAVRTLRTVPPGARVEIDGRAEGVTPVTVRLAPGVHSLRLERFGYHAWEAPLVLEGAAMTEHEVVLTPADGRELRAQAGRREGLDAPPDADTLRRLQREFHVAAVLVARRDGGVTRFPPASASRPLWPWIVAGAAVAGVALGVGLYLGLGQEPRFNLVAPSD